MIKKKSLRKAVLTALGTATLTASGQALATGGSVLAPGNAAFTDAGLSINTPNYVWDGGNINTVGAPQSTGPMGPPLYETIGAKSANLGWNHTISWKLFEITKAGGYTISLDRKTTGNPLWNPAFSLFTSGAARWDMAGSSHSFNQVVGPDRDVKTRVAAWEAAMEAYTNSQEYKDWEAGGRVGPPPPGQPDPYPAPAGVGKSYAVDGSNTDDYMAYYGTTPYQSETGTLVNGVTGFVGYANSGSWFVNGDGNFARGAQDQEPGHTGSYYSATNYTYPGSNLTGPYDPSKDGYEIVLNNTAGHFNAHVAGGATLRDGAGNPVSEWDAAHSGDISAAFAGGGSSVNTADGHAELSVWLTPGWYVLGPAGSCYDLSCGTVLGQATLKILPNPNVTAPVSEYTLQVNNTGTDSGTGKVTSTPAGIDCGTVCSAAFAKGKSVKLTATPTDSGSQFNGWSGACTGTGNCTVTMDAAKSVTASFGVAQFELKVTSVNGTVTGNGINCGTGVDSCSTTVKKGTKITLTATPDSGFDFDSWTGCTSTTSTCEVTVDGNTQVAATFRVKAAEGNAALTVTCYNGTVTSDVADANDQRLNCNNTSRSVQFKKGTVVTLTAKEDEGFQFDGWGDSPCEPANDNSCTVKIDDAKTVTVSFVPDKFVLTVDPPGHGKVTSTPAGIDCAGPDDREGCEAPFPNGATVTLTADPADGFKFDSWSDDCSIDQDDKQKCIVTMDAAKSVTATFAEIPAPNESTLTVTKTGSGKVTSSPGGIDCGSDCTENYAKDTSVTLTATPDSGHQFSGWGGACSGTGPCTVTMDDERNVTAAFAAIPAPNQSSLTVIKTRHGGTVTSSPAGIRCGSDCSENYNAGASVALTAVPDEGYRFAGWSGGGCARDPACTVTVNGTKVVNAVFAPLPVEGQFALTVTKSGNGKVASDPAGIDCGTDCSENVDAGTSVTLTATPDEGYQFSGWSGGCSGTDPCTVALGKDTDVTATFAVTSGGGKFAFTVTKTGDGSVTSSPAGIDCGETCSASFDGGASVTLTAKPGAGRSFGGWGGACQGREACTVTMSEARNVTAAFVQPPHRDFDGDGLADLFWRQNRTGSHQLWLMSEGKIKASEAVARKGKAWILAASADLNGDLQPDLLWRHRATGEVQLWLMKGWKVKTEAVLPDLATGFSEVRAGDFDHDGKPDLLWHNPTTGEAGIWLMNASALKKGVKLPTAPAGARLSAVMDFNGDGSVDVWWYNPSTGQNALWLMNGTDVQSTEIPPPQTGSWTFAGAGQFDGDAKGDILWRNRAGGKNQIWLMDGANRTSSVDLPALRGAWSAASIDDFDGNGKPDILWRNRKNGKNRIWRMDGTSVAGKTPIEANGKGWSTPAH